MAHGNDVKIACYFLNGGGSKQADDEDPVDPLPTIRAECLKACPAPKAAYDACVKRIEDKGEGDCEAWYFDMLHCVDKCVAPKVFATLK
eukprot:CAMPEP_0185725716 /NCGR_PEP_ID=MMETSP1171-20130828/1907_1 /TAXON_ID=374046 /ORGANISM="Helicotheca tamensis, Strain CCMP826" /LENGTH=88 /DNA_ID=CAMNT_0028393909 /DNA_START=76 /DNA_END=342 /DNA_ORIENTATION=+